MEIKIKIEEKICEDVNKKPCPYISFYTTEYDIEKHCTLFQKKLKATGVWYVPFRCKECLAQDKVNKGV